MTLPINQGFIRFKGLGMETSWTTTMKLWCFEKWERIWPESLDVVQ